MNSLITVSVIMPAYNAEATVERALESVLDQTLRALEVIVIDDGSTDGTAEILSKMAANDARLRVIRRENGGAASARNEAIPLARGKYLYFADADDWLNNDMLERMAALAQAHSLELAICGFTIRTQIKDGREHICMLCAEDRVYPSRQAFREDAYRLFDLNLLYTPWNKLFLADYVRREKLSFPPTFWDDFPFNLAAIRDIERVGVLGAPLYHFTRAREESETAKYRKDMYQKREEEHAWMLDLYQHWNLFDDNSYEMIYRRYIERVIGCIENVVNPANTLRPAEKMALIRSMLENEQVALALKLAQPRSAFMKLMLIPLRMKSAFFCYLEGVTISRVKQRNRRLFAALKANR